MTNNTTISLGKNIRKYRERLGMTQEELAFAVGFETRGAIYRIEKGERNVSSSIVVAIAQALHVSVQDLVGASTEIDPYKPFYEFLPYLEKAEEWQLQAVRELLKMPNKKESSSNFMQKAN